MHPVIRICRELRLCTNIAQHPKTNLHVVADIHAPSAKSVASQHGASVVGIDDVFADASIDAVVICTSTDTHADLMESAARAGKAVFCEKPIDLSLERATATLRMLKKHPVPAMLGFNRRFDPNMAALQSAAIAGEIGQTEMLSITSFDPAPPPIEYVKVSGGLFRDMAIHDIDLACWIMGSRPTAVTATGSCLVDAGIGEAGDVDTAVSILHFADGRLATIRNSRRAAYGYDQRLELLGSKGLLAVDNQHEHTLVRATSDGVLRAKPEYFFLERYGRAFSLIWDHFAQALLADREPAVTTRDGVVALAIAEAATASLTACETIEIDYPDGL